MRSAVEGPRARGGFRIQLLGSFTVQVDGNAAEAGHWRLRKARALVAMLALAPGQRCQREQILDRLWPDLEFAEASRNLHQTLYVARRTLAGLGVAGDCLMILRDGRVVLDGDGDVAVDVLEFERVAAAALASGVEAGLRDAAELYVGELLPEFPDAQWLMGRRVALGALNREVLVKLAATVRHDAPEEALVILRRLLESDPLHEGAVRAEMLVLAGLGRRSEALARYELLVEDLLEAFGTDPDEQTTRLFRELLAEAPAARPSRPPVGSSAGAVGSVPVPVSSFIGRERELSDVERLLDRARLLTLTGAGGCGKTRLALEAARRARARYADGVWFVDLATVAAPSGVAEAVACVLRLDSGTSAGRVQALVNHLRRTSVLLVLDNCEHLLSACAQLVSRLIARCPGVDVLATSREPLHAPGEYTFRVPSLALPSPIGPEGPDLAEMGAQSSVALFVERAGQVRPGFALTADNARGINDLCRRLDGIPLALELAAARTTLLEPAEIVLRLGDALAVLGGVRGGVTRHQTLRGTLEWSHALLTEPERILLRRLSVFPASFSLGAVESVCGQAPLRPVEILELLANLVDKSLVVTQTTAVETRYRQLETVRQFGHEFLVRAGEEAQLRIAHCAFFLDFAVSHNPEQMVGVVLEEPRLLDLEHDNLRAALRWSCSHEPETALRLAASLWRFWFVRGHSVEGADWVERALAASSEPTRARAAALIGLAGLDSRRGRGDRHRALGAEAMAIMRLIGEPDEIVAARLMEAALVWGTFGLDEAEQLTAEIRAEAAEHDRPERLAAGSWLLGQCALSREDGPLADSHLRACLSELGQVATTAAPFLPVITPSIQLIPVGDRLVPSFEETLLLGRRVGAVQGVGYVLSALGDAARLSADPQAAIAVICDAVEHFTSLGDDLARGQVLHQLGCIRRDSGDHRGAEEALLGARQLRVGLGDRRGELLTEIHLALLHARGGDIEGGGTDARRCLTGFESVGDQVGIGATLTILAIIGLLAGDVATARDLYCRAAERFTPWRRHAGWARLMAAELSSELGDPLRADRETAKAEAAFGATCCVVASERLAARRRSPGAGVEDVLSPR